MQSISKYRPNTQVHPWVHNLNHNIDHEINHPQLYQENLVIDSLNLPSVSA